MKFTISIDRTTGQITHGATQTPINVGWLTRAAMIVFVRLGAVAGCSGFAGRCSLFVLLCDLRAQLHLLEVREGARSAIGF